MKNFKKLALSLVMFLCLFVLAACGETKTQLDYQVKVNTNTSGYAVETISNKNEITQFTTGTGESSIANNTKGFKLTMKMVIDLGEDFYTSIDATGIYLLATENPQIGIKLNTKMKMGDSQIKFSNTMYLKNNIYYLQIPTGKYYMNPADQNFEEYAASFSDMKDFDLSEEFAKINELLNEQTVNMKKYVKVEKNKTTTKLKINVPNTEGGHENLVYLVFENDIFKGMHYSLDALGQVVKVDLVPFNGKIDFPSFKEYKNIASIGY